MYDKLSEEISGNSPTCYGNCTSEFKTPNSDITFHTTFKKFYRADEKANQEWVIPNIKVDSKKVNLKSESKLLYNKIKLIINEFYKNQISSMEDACKKYMVSDRNVPTFLNKEEFEKQSEGNLILYRRFDNVSATNDFYNRKVYFSTNTNNMRETGIYTTSSRVCVEYYSEGSYFSNDVYF